MDDFDRYRDRDQDKDSRSEQQHRKQIRKRQKRRWRKLRNRRDQVNGAIIALCRAAAQGNLKKVQRLIKAFQYDPRHGTPQGVTALHCASYCGQLEVVKYLIEEAKCDLTAKDNEGECPLAYSAKCTMNKSVMKSPLNHFSAASDPISYDQNFRTALYLIRSRLALSALICDKKTMHALRLPFFTSYEISLSDQTELIESMISIFAWDSINELVCQELYTCFKIAIERYDIDYDIVELLICTYTTHIKKAIEYNSDRSKQVHALLHKALRPYAHRSLIKFLTELDLCKPNLTCFKEAIRMNNYDIVHHLFGLADSSLLPQLLLYTLDQIRNTGDCRRCRNLPKFPDERLTRLILVKCMSCATEVTIRDAEGNNPLHLACNNVHGKEIISCINEANSSYQTIPNNNHQLPLHTACEIDYEAIQLVSSHPEIDISLRDKDGSTPLHILCISLSTRFRINDGCVLDCFKYLILQKKSNINIKDNKGRLPLHVLLKYLAYSISEDKHEELLNLCSDDASINVQDSDGNTPLHLACTHKLLKAVFYFASNSCCNKDLRNVKRHLPIHSAVSSHMLLKAVKAVNDGCTRITTQSSDFKTLLCIAFREKQINVIKYLVAKYCSHVSHLSKVYDNLDISLLCRDERDIEILKFFANKHNISQTDIMGNTLIHIACTHNNLMAAKFLTKDLNCDLSCKNSSGQLPLHIACSHSESLDFVRLTSHKCDVNVCDNNGRTPLHFACQAGSFDIVQHLVERFTCRPSMIKRDSHHFLPADYACKHSLEMVMLVSPSYSMLKDIAYYDTVTTLDVACSYGALDMVQYLVNQHGYTLSALGGSHNALLYACGLLKVNGYRSVFDRDVNIHEDVVEFLISKCSYNPLKVCLHHNSIFDNVSLFKYACRHNHLNLMKALTIHSVNLQEDTGNTPLHYACEYKCTEIVQFLVNSNCDQTLCDKESEVPLHVACRISLEITQLLSTEYDVINSQNNDGDTPLHIACAQSRNDIIEYLLKQELCRADVLNRNGDLALHNLLNPKGYLIEDFIQKFDRFYFFIKPFAVTPLPILKLMLNKYKKAAAVCNKDGLSPLHIAVLKEEVNFFEILDENRYYGFPKKNVLHLACLYRKPKIVHWLIQHGARHAVKNSSGNLPQHLCFMGQHRFCMQTLIQLGSLDICSQNEDNNTIIHMVCKMGKIDILKKILEGSNVRQNHTFSIQNNDMDTPLHLAVANCKSTELVELVATPHNVNIQNSDGDSPLHIACRRHKNCWNDIHLRIIKFFICKLKSSVEVVNNNCDSPFHILLRKILPRGNRIVQLIPKPLFCVRNKNCETILHLACFTGDRFPMIVSLLIKSMIQNFTTDIICKIIGSGATLLHFACIAGDLDIVRLLVDCDPLAQITDRALLHNSQCVFGDTALHVACRYQDSNIVRYLLTTKHKKALKVSNDHSELPIHIACRTQEIIKIFVGFQNNFDCNSQNNLGNTVLHIACGEPNTQEETPKGVATVVALLLYKFKCNPCIPNSHNNLPLHVACQYEVASLDLIKLLSAGLSNDQICLQNDDGNTPLHLLLSSSYGFQIHEKVLHGQVKFFINEAPTLAHIRNKNDKQPIHLACHNHRLLIVKHFFQNTKSSELPSLLLHEACYNENSDVLKYVITNPSHSHDINLADANGDIPLHLAICLKRSKECIHDLIQLTTNINQKNRDGNTPLHEACATTNEYDDDDDDDDGDSYYDPDDYYDDHYNDDYYGYDDYFDRLCDKCRYECMPSSPKEVNNDTRHLSGLIDAEPTVDEKDILYGFKELLKIQAINLSIKNSLGQTPLHCLCTKRLYEGLRLVLNQKTLNFNANLQDGKGLTLLHIACEHNCRSAVKLLLSSARAKPSIKDNLGQTPITLTNHPRIIKLLIEYGADPQPLYDMHREFFHEFSSEKPPPTPVNVMVVGHPSVGKTTLIQSLQSESFEKVVSEKFEHTAGVVPTNFKSQIYGEVTFYDFAGQPEYYASHDAVIHSTLKNVPPIVLIIVNLNKPDNIIHDQLHYWINFIGNRCASLKDKAHLIVIGSHADFLKSQGMNPPEKILQFRQPIETQTKTKKICIKGYFDLNCTESSSDKMVALCNVLQESTNGLRETGVMHFNSHCFYVFLLHMFKGDDFVTLGRVISTLKLKADESGDNPLFVLPSDQPAVIKLCQDLDEKGHLMFVEHPSILDMSWLIINKVRLLKNLIGPLFAPADFPQHCPLSYSTGVVPLSHFDKHLNAKHNYPSSLSLTFLSRMECCREVIDKQVLECIVESEKFSELEKYYFFPNLVSLERPNDKWSTDPDFSYKCGWLIQCTTEGEYFSPHFIQVLLLRLAFSFTPQKMEYDTKDLETYKCNSESYEFQNSNVKPFVINRYCSVWKNGIYWQEESGVNTIVDVLHQRTLILLMQCLKDREIDLINRRSQIISMVLNAKHEYCSGAKILEYFIHPDCVTHPLLNLENIRSHLYSFPRVKATIVTKKPCVVNEDDKRVKLEDLLYFEPYSELSMDTNRLKTVHTYKERMEQLSIFRGRQLPQGMATVLMSV